MLRLRRRVQAIGVSNSGQVGRGHIAVFACLTE